MTIRLATADDLGALLRLFAQLNADDPALEDERARQVFDEILTLPHLEFIVAERERHVVATCYLNVIPNLTRSARPYAILENVVVERAWRRKGIGKAIVAFALSRAWDRGCYKVMLQTGSRRASTPRFYRACGFASGQRYAFLARPETPGVG